eukprot:4054064-Pyramimonas_sp.AAC.2
MRARKAWMLSGEKDVDKPPLDHEPNKLHQGCQGARCGVELSMLDGFLDQGAMVLWVQYVASLSQYDTDVSDGRRTGIILAHLPSVCTGKLTYFSASYWQVVAVTFDRDTMQYSQILATC